jgi:hypothetical protein
VLSFVLRSQKSRVETLALLSTGPDWTAVTVMANETDAPALIVPRLQSFVGIVPETQGSGLTETKLTPAGSGTFRLTFVALTD